MNCYYRIGKAFWRICINRFEVIYLLGALDYPLPLPPSKHNQGEMRNLPDDHEKHHFEIDKAGNLPCTSPLLSQILVQCICSSALLSNIHV